MKSTLKRESKAFEIVESEAFVVSGCLVSSFCASVRTFVFSFESLPRKQSKLEMAG